MSDLIRDLAIKVYDTAVQQFELIRRTSTAGVIANQGKVSAAVATLPAPAYRQLEISRQGVVDLKLDPTLTPAYRDFFYSSEGDVSILFTNPLEPAAIQGFFERLIDTTIRANAAGEYTPHSIFAFKSVLQMIGAFATIPTELQPSLNVAFKGNTFIGPDAVYEPSRYEMGVNVTEGVSTGASVFASMLHEFRHFLQFLRGLQAGNAIEIATAPSAQLIAGASIYLPTINETDPVFAATMDYYSAFADHTFFKTIDANMMLQSLKACDQKDLRKFAELIGVKSALPIEQVALGIYTFIDFHMLNDFDAITSLLTNQGISPKLIDTIKTIAIRKYFAYKFDPKECEVGGLTGFGLTVGNPLLLQETIIGGRGVQQMPLDEASRRIFYEDLTATAKERQAAVSAIAPDFAVRDLLGGGSGAKVYAAAQLSQITLPAEYRDVEALQRRLMEKTDRIAEAARASAALIDARIRK